MLKTVKDLTNLLDEKGIKYTIDELNKVDRNSHIKIVPTMATLKYVGYNPHKIFEEDVLLNGIIFKNNHGNLGSLDGFISTNIIFEIYNGHFKMDTVDFLDLTKK